MSETHTLAQAIGIWVAAFLTLVAYSFLYRDNPAYRFAEALFIGVSAGYFFAIAWRDSILPDLVLPLCYPKEGEPREWLRLVPAVLGLLMLARFHPRTSYLSRWPMAFTIGMYAGMGIPATIKTDILKQMQATMKPPVVLAAPGTHWGMDQFVGSLTNTILIVGVLSVLAYFFFSKEHKGTYGRFCRLGVCFLMFSFGATFGYTVMARVSLLIGRVNFLLHDWLHVI